MFKHADDAVLIDRPVRFGPEFKRPSTKTKRLQKAKRDLEHGKNMFSAEELRRMIDTAGVPLKAMLLLAVNCGFGNSDCGMLPLAALDLERGWMDYPRPKTGMPRRAKLWPETVQAIKDAIDARPEPKNPDHARLVFITKQGGSFSKDTPDNPISKECNKLMNALSINGKRGFYSARHTFATIAGDTGDQVAVDFAMGHAKDDMPSRYRESFERGTLARMTEVTRILSAIEQGAPHAAEQLLPLVYDELRRLAAQKLAQEKPGQTLQATALVHEAYVRLTARPAAPEATLPGAAPDEPTWNGRAHFFGAAAEAMRRILVERARRKQRHKHGGGHRRADFEVHGAPIDAVVESSPDELVALDEEILALDHALTQLAEEDPAAAKVVQLHFFAGLPIEQVAEALGTSRATAYRQWAYARAWLRSAMGADSAPGE